MFRDFRRGHQALHVLLWGRRGAGKTHVLEAALADAGIAPGRTAVPVKLSGLVHVSEDIAMRALAAQLW